MAQFLPALTPARDENGNVSGGAQWFFYSENTLTPAELSGGATSATANSSGEFDPLETVSATNYRARLLTSAGRQITEVSLFGDSYFSAGVLQALDNLSRAVSGATWSFYTTGTTAPKPVYADPDLDVPLGAVVTADANGRFPEIYLDTAITYKAVRTVNGTVDATLDPVTENSMGLFLDPDYIQYIEPSGDWDGSAGSGFSAAPTDPTRTTAKPALVLIEPDLQAFTDELEVGVMAMANNSGTMIGGIDELRVYFENDTYSTVANPTFRTLTRADGTTYQCLGYWFRLKKPSGTAGEAQLYIEAVPADGTMQNRVIGPYSYFPRTSLYDYEVTVNASQAEVAGSNYQTLTAAIKYMADTVASDHGHILVQGTVSERPTKTWVNYTGSAGWLTIECDTGATLTITETVEANKGEIRLRYDNIRWKGSGITFDMRYILNIRDEATGPYWLDGIYVTNSGGRYELWDKGPRNANWVLRNAGWITECVMDNTWFTLCGVGFPPKARGNKCSEVAGDFSRNPTLLYYNVLDDQDNTDLKNEIDSMTLQYTGSAGTATISLSGQADTDGRVFTIKEDGVTIDTLTLQNTAPASANYDVSDVVTWLNSQTDWTATLLDDTRRATALSDSSVPNGDAFTDVDAKTAAVTLYTQFDVHPDTIQVAGAYQNGLAGYNTAYNLYSQNFHNNNNSITDFALVNNAFHMADPELWYSNFSEPTAHLCVVNNTWTSQTVRQRTSEQFDPDAYTLFANNTAEDVLGGNDNDFTNKDWHLQSGATGPDVGTFTSGGTFATLFSDPANGNFTPAGDLLTNLKTTVLTYDLNNDTRGATSPAGAVDA